MSKRDKTRNRKGIGGKLFGLLTAPVRVGVKIGEKAQAAGRATGQVIAVKKEISAFSQELRAEGITLRLNIEGKTLLNAGGDEKERDAFDIKLLSILGAIRPIVGLIKAILGLVDSITKMLTSPKAKKLGMKILKKEIGGSISS